MKSQIKIIDKFLPDDKFEKLKSIFLDRNFPWYFSESSVYDGDSSPQFSHAIYDNMEPTSNCWNHIKHILINQLELRNYQTILRVKVNATPKTFSVEPKSFHYDIELEDDIKDKIEELVNYNVAIIYLNTNDGFTYFKDGAKVESIENRCVIFPGNLMHSGSTCTNSPLRVVLNINYTL